MVAEKVVPLVVRMDELRFGLMVDPLVGKKVENLVARKDDA